MSSTPAKTSYAGKIIVITGLLSIGYAILRYHIIGPVPWKDFPLFILNKGFSLTGFLLLTLNFSIGPLNNLWGKVGEGWLNARQALGVTGFLLVFIHLIMSLLLFKPEILGSFFEADSSVTFIGGLSMLGGILGFVALWTYTISFQTFLREDKAFIRFITSRKFLLVAMLFSAAHIFFMGYKGWMDAASWYGGLPPISLVAFSFFMIGYGINLVGRK